MPKITLLGAGSGFTQPLFTDILLVDGMDRGTIGLVDIDKKRLDVNVKLMHKIIELTGRTKWKIEASTDRRKVLKGSDYLISTIEVSGTACVGYDNDIPLKYGIDQCIGDTIGPGGIMKALRTAPPFIKILEDAAKYCPNALIMNYTNPMSIMTLISVRSTNQPFVGLCHSVQGSSRRMAKVAGVPYEEMAWRCGGINHMSWFTELRHKGRDLYPRILSAVEDKETYKSDPVRFGIMKEFGYFVTESSGHFSEYVPYFRKRPDLIGKHCGNSYLGGSGFYAKSWPGWRRATDKARKRMADGKQEIPLNRGHEYASNIIEAHLLDRQKTIYASVANNGLIVNLPQTGVVEVAVLVDKQGFTPTHFGALPEQVAALCRSNMSVFELCAQGILNRDREAIIHAMMLDPLSAAVCTPDEIRKMSEKLFRAEKEYIPSWCNPRRTATRKQKVAGRTKPGKDGTAEVSSMAARNVQ